MILNLFNPSRISAGFIAVLVGYTSSVAIILQAGEAAGATSLQMSSWLWALGIGMGLSTIGLSLYYKMPILTAWSTPGAALLVTSLSGVTVNEAVGAFVFASILAVVAGLSGGFKRMMDLFPTSLASAMLAGVLLRFGLDAFVALQSAFALVTSMLLVYLLAKHLLPRYTMPLVLLAGLVFSGVSGDFNSNQVDWSLSWPVWIEPVFNMQVLIGVGLPLFIVTMTSQNIPGIATLRANGYKPPINPLITWTGITGLLLSPMGGYAFNLAAITAAICQGEEADPDAEKRYLAAVWAGLFYLLTGAFGAAVVGLFAAFPKEMVMAVAGLALLGTIANALEQALSSPGEREAAMLTFMITASGISLLGIGAAFWGLLVGFFVHMLSKRRRRL